MAPQALNDEITIRKNEVWAMITARGGSKSIPLKNLANLNGRPLLDYAIKAGQATPSISRVICSTENDKIADFCRSAQIEVQARPLPLAGDDTPSLDVILYFLETSLSEEGFVPEFLVLLEPTSPFVLPEHIEGCLELLKNDPDADSAQTITPVEHNSHAFNQRFLDENGSHFFYDAQHKKCFSKQRKPKFYIHGNVRVMRSRSVLKNKDIFGNRSLPLVISRAYSMDVDGPEEFQWAECIIRGGLVKLPA